ncbi:MAG: cytochrome P450 [Planctomycetota bacterium]
MLIDESSQTVHIDIRDPDFYQDPYRCYERLHERCPTFFWHEHGLWTFTRHADVSVLLRNRRLGRQISHLRSRDSLGRPPEPASLKPFFDVDNLAMIGREPPSHTRLRGLVQKAFMGKQIEQWRPRIESLCDDLIDEMLQQSDSGEMLAFDLLRSYATPIPVRIIAEMLGVPAEIAPQLLRWSGDMIQMYEMIRTPAMEAAAVKASQEFVAYLRRLVETRRLSPGDDLISELIAVEAEGERLTENELIANCILLLNAGHEATVNVIGNGMLALIRHPDQLERWREAADADDQRFHKSAVEEILRFDTPLHQFNRWVLEPMTIGDQTFEVGQEVALLLGAANRDPKVFPSPNALDLSRRNNPHVSFGGGIHYCLGAPLARLEVQIAIPKLLRRLTDWRLDESPRYRNNFHFHGLESLCVVSRPRY